MVICGDVRGLLLLEIKGIRQCMSPVIRLILARLVEWTTEKEKAPHLQGAFALRWTLLDCYMVGRRTFNSLSNHSIFLDYFSALIRHTPNSYPEYAGCHMSMLDYFSLHRTSTRRLIRRSRNAHSQAERSGEAVVPQPSNLRRSVALCTASWRSARLSRAGFTRIKKVRISPTL
jgi:hypothetical protein